MTIKNLALFSGALLLAGCPGSGDTGTPIHTGTPTETDPPASTPAFVWNVTMEDGGAAAPTADSTITSTENAVANFPDIVDFDFGLAQTDVTDGWFGEDCDGNVTNGSDICHTMLPDTTMTLTWVAEIADIVPGSTTINNVDTPASATPGVSFVLFGYDMNDAVVQCWAQGHTPGHWSTCEVYVPAM